MEKVNAELSHMYVEWQVWIGGGRVLWHPWFIIIETSSIILLHTEYDNMHIRIQPGF